MTRVSMPDERVKPTAECCDISTQRQTLISSALFNARLLNDGVHEAHTDFVWSTSESHRGKVRTPIGVQYDRALTSMVGVALILFLPVLLATLCSAMYAQLLLIIMKNDQCVKKGHSQAADMVVLEHRQTIRDAQTDRLVATPSPHGDL
ncbi:hypothetical protein FKP32DRAFT_838925 [Trametes sanguinea]|nr:hypothetical protein FKP32DRAFT_838925 [Trametes sanguinea]